MASPPPAVTPPSAWGGTLGSGAYSNNSGGAGAWLGEAGTPGDAYFGGTPGAAAAATDYYTGQANQAGNVAAPTIDTAGAQQAQAGFYGQGIGAQQNAVNLLGQTATGGGPAQQAAQAQLRQGVDASVNSNLALANSARGQAGLANAQKNAMTANAATTQGAAAQASQLQAGMSAQAQGQLAGAAGQLSQSYLGEQGQAAQQAQQQAALQEQQNQTNQQGALGYQQLGFNAQQSALQAQEANQSTSAGLNENNASNKSNLLGTTIGTVGKVVESFLDVKMREPGGRSGWTIREEPDFLLARNDRTGELRKLATQPLTREEHAQAMAPHGAGPIEHGLGQVVSDLPIGGAPTNVYDVVGSDPESYGLDPSVLSQSLDARAAQQASAPNPYAPSTPASPSLGADIGGAGYGGGDMATLEGPGTDMSTNVNSVVGNLDAAANNPTPAAAAAKKKMSGKPSLASAFGYRASAPNISTPAPGSLPMGTLGLR